MGVTKEPHLTPETATVESVQALADMARIRALILNTVRSGEQTEAHVFYVCREYAIDLVNDTIGTMLDARLVAPTVIDGRANGFGVLPALRLS
jgi:hypothetical protein